MLDSPELHMNESVTDYIFGEWEGVSFDILCEYNQRSEWIKTSEVTEAASSFRNLIGRVGGVVNDPYC